MKTTLLVVTSVVLFLGIVATSFVVLNLSRQNNELTGHIERLDQQLSDKAIQLDASEAKVRTLSSEASQLSTEADRLAASLLELQSTYDELYGFAYCGDELIELEEMNYSSNAKALEALTQWVDDMWGDVKGSHWVDFWTADGPGLHVVETGYANDYFVVYFQQQDFFDAPSGVFIVSHHCWLDVELD